MSFSFGRNIAALRAQRRLEQSSESSQRALERLASGQRINRASDDAAGLSVAMRLSSDGRVLAQAVRNINDAISMLSLAETAVRGLSEITIRQRELALQAANGALRAPQRRALNAEANALVEEYNRIVATTKFNGTTVLSSSATELSVQLGASGSDNVSFRIGAGLSRTIGTGSLAASQSYTAALNSFDVTSADLDGDGYSDIINVNQTENVVSVFLNNGNGTFKARVTYSAQGGARGITILDANGDGITDLAVANQGPDTVSVLLGNGNGTFKAQSAFATGVDPLDLRTGDVNGDGFADLVTSDYGPNSSGPDTLSILLGNGNGSFRARISVSTLANPYDHALGDINGDGKLDIVVALDSTGGIGSYLGKGDGTFTSIGTFAAGTRPIDVTLADLNRDGNLDAIASHYVTGAVAVFLGNGDGTFGAATNFTNGTESWDTEARDMNGDGYLDIVSTSAAQSRVSIFLGNGNGTFQARRTFVTGAGPLGIYTQDLNNDGALDVITSNYGEGSVSVLLSNTTTTASAPYISLLTRDDALASIATLEATLARVTTELGAIGSSQSRLTAALNNLSTVAENYKAAASRIMDVDIAVEAAEVLRNQVLQQSAAAILAQANQEPALVLRLLTD